MDNLLGTVFGKLVLVLGITAVAALMYVGINRSKEAGVVSDLSQISANVSAFYQGQSTGYSALTTPVLTNPTNGLLPSDVSAASVSVVSATPTYWTGTLALPSGVSCAKIYMSLGSANQDSQSTSCGTAGVFTFQFQ